MAAIGGFPRQTGRSGGGAASAIACPNRCGRFTTGPILRDLGECLRCASVHQPEAHDDAYAAALARGGVC